MKYDDHVLTDDEIEAFSNYLRKGLDDGTFRNIVLPKGTVVYHGSSNPQVSKRRISDIDDTEMFWVTRNLEKATFYASLNHRERGRRYSRRSFRSGAEKRVSAFKLKRDTTILAIDDDWLSHGGRWNLLKYLRDYQDYDGFLNIEGQPVMDTLLLHDDRSGGGEGILIFKPKELLEDFDDDQQEMKESVLFESILSYDKDAPLPLFNAGKIDLDGWYGLDGRFKKFYRPEECYAMKGDSISQVENPLHH